MNLLIVILILCWFILGLFVVVEDIDECIREAQDEELLDELWADEDCRCQRHFWVPDCPVHGVAA